MRSPRRLSILFLPALLLAPGCRGPEMASAVPGLEYREEARSDPRPLRFFVLTADLPRKDLALAVAVAKDPDGDGPAEAALADPLALCREAGLAAAVNCNPFDGFPDASGRKDRSWRQGQRVDISGLAASAGEVRSPAQEGYVAFWTDGEGRPHLGQPGPGETVREGCAGFGWIAREGKSVAAGPERHPRTAIGLDRERKKLWLVVVDGRQPGWSEGLTLPELAQYMLDLGAWDAVNLDGGGSSILILRDRPGRPEFMNRPSTRAAGRNVPRPVPTLLGIRRIAPGGS